jgi:hypothetical protein
MGWLTCWNQGEPPPLIPLAKERGYLNGACYKVLTILFPHWDNMTAFWSSKKHNFSFSPKKYPEKYYLELRIMKQNIYIT